MVKTLGFPCIQLLRVGDFFPDFSPFFFYSFDEPVYRVTQIRNLAMAIIPFL